MALWNTKQEDLTAKTGTREKITVNGIYEMEIKEAYLTNSKQSKAQAVTIAFENDVNYGRVNFWFLKGDGTENEFATKSLNRLLYLCKLKSENLKEVKKTVKGFGGKEIERTFLPDLHGKQIGMIIETKKDGDNINLEIKDFFDIKSRKTSDEIINKMEASTVIFFEDKYAKEEKNKPADEELPYDTDKNITTVTSLDDDEFPF